MVSPQVEAFFDKDTFTVSYVVYGADRADCIVIDPVLDYDPKAGRISTRSAQRIVDFLAQHQLQVRWILETHAHADHLSAAQWLKQQVGGLVAIGEHIGLVQRHFARLYNLEPDFPVDGSQFDRLLAEGDRLQVGDLSVEVWHTPGHTPACVTYLIGDAVFLGDTLFMPDYGTARTDFPGGDATALFHSIRRILALPPATRLFMCHDYLPGGRAAQWQTTVAAQRGHNLMIRDGITEEDFVQERTQRDAKLAAPVLILPSLQVNIRAGHLPEPAANGIQYLKIPLNQLAGGQTK